MRPRTLVPSKVPEKHVFLHMIFGRTRPIFIEKNTFLREIILLRKPDWEIRLGNHIDLCPFPASGSGTVVVRAVSRRVIRQHVHRNNIGNHIDFDIIVISHPPLRAAPVIDMSVDQDVLRVDHRNPSGEKRAHGRLEKTADIVVRTGLLFRQQQRKANAKPSFLGIADFYGDSILNEMLHIFRCTSGSGYNRQ